MNRSKAYYRLGQTEKARADYDVAARRGSRDDVYRQMLERAREETRGP